MTLPRRPPRPELPESLDERRDALWQHRKALDAWIDEVWEARDGLSLGDRMIRNSVIAALRITGLYNRGCKNALHPVLRERTLPIPKRFDTLDGCRIIHLADPHFDAEAHNLAPTLALLRELDCDIAVFTGDCFYEHDTPAERVLESMRELCGSVQCEGPVYACLGNNDPADFVENSKSINIKWLVNQGQAISVRDDTIWIAGVDDPHKYRCDDIASAMNGTPDDALRVLLAHTPEIDRQAQAHGAHIYLCGHTHGGQLCLPGGFAPYKNGKSRSDQVVGCWQRREMAGHTSAGLGCTAVPTRFNCPPEVVRLTLRAVT